MKKILSVLLSIVMLFSFATVSVSAEGLAQTGVIYLNQMRADTVYKLYKVLDLASVSADGTAFSYKINLEKDENEKFKDPWADFVTEDTTAKLYLTVDEHGAISTTAAFVGEEATIRLAKAAIAFASEKNIVPFTTSEEEIDGEINTNFARTNTGGMFKNLPAGYYLFESAVGTLGALVTARPNAPAYINVKNNAPIVEKLVFEDSVNDWQTSNSVEIGQEIFFKATIYAQAGAENYAFHDAMTGMQLFTDENGYKIEVKHHKNKYDAAAGEQQEVTLTEGENNDYTLHTDNPHAGVTFGIKFTQAFCDRIEANDKIIIYYSAVLTDQAEIAGDGNPNTCWVNYGALNQNKPSFETAPSTTHTHTYGIDIVKTNNSGESLPGAMFNLYPALADGKIDENNPIKFIYNEDAQTYYVNYTNQNRNKDFVAGDKTMRTTVGEGEDAKTLEGSFAVATLIGLDNGTYYLRETAAPAGYNMLTEDRVFTISSNNMRANFTVAEVGETESTTKTTYTGGGIHIENKKGDRLPETGGMGTTLFVTIGAVMVLGAGVLLVTKKRMSMIED